MPKSIIATKRQEVELLSDLNLVERFYSLAKTIGAREYAGTVKEGTMIEHEIRFIKDELYLRMGKGHPISQTKNNVSNNN